MSYFKNSLTLQVMPYPIKNLMLKQSNHMNILQRRMPHNIKKVALIGAKQINIRMRRKINLIYSCQVKMNLIQRLRGTTTIQSDLIQ